jgi:hypothetical protein
MERDGDGDVNGRIRFGPDVLRHSRPSNVSTTWDIKTLHIIKLCNFLARQTVFFLIYEPVPRSGS